MTVQGFILPHILQVVSQFEPFFFRIPTGPLAVRGICPYAFGVVQHRKFFTHGFYWASRAVVLCFFSSEQGIFFETLERPLFGEENIGRHSYARCARLPPELVGHNHNVSLYLPLCKPVVRVATTFFRVPNLNRFARVKRELRFARKGCLRPVFYFWYTQPRIPPTTSDETMPATHQMTFC